MTTQELLKATRKRFSDHSKWMQEAYGTIDGPNCIAGGVFYEAGGVEIYCSHDIPTSYKETIELIMEALPDKFQRNVATFNDNSTYEEVMALLDSLIVPDTIESDHIEELVVSR